MSPELYSFLYDLAHWVQDGCPVDERFQYDCPICCVPLCVTGYARSATQAAQMRSELQELFEKEYGNAHYPFGEKDWDTSNELNDFYSPAERNLKRLEFLERYL